MSFDVDEALLQENYISVSTNKGIFFITEYTPINISEGSLKVNSFFSPLE